MAARFVKNTLLSRPFVQRIAGLPRHDEASSALAGIVAGFEKMRAHAGEIHTELHLVKPILKVLGYAFESKPMFFEERIKGPDFALFSSEEERVKSASLWGTKPYYEHVLALALVKRYGRSLEEGIGGFYLEFENRIPLYQSLYLAKKTGVPWSILTNGKTWLLVKRPFAFEKPLVEIDLEQAISNDDSETVHLFYQIFSSAGLGGTLAAFLEEERTALIAFLKEKRRFFATTMEGGPKSLVYGAMAPLYGQLFPEGGIPSAAGARPERAGMPIDNGRPAKPIPVKEYDQSDIFTYLVTRGAGTETSTDELILGVMADDRTKDALLSLKIFDMTAGFGATAARLVEAMAYLSFLLPYREKHSFVAEWENEPLLHRFVLDQVLYGVETYPFPLDVLQSSLLARFNCPGTNYRLGNPLLGMSVMELLGVVGQTDGTGLRAKDAGDVMSRLRETYRLYSALSDRIKEDAVVKGELASKLAVYRERLRDIMDLAMASYFEETLETKKIGELLYCVEGDEAVWQEAERGDRFRAARELAGRKRFFHMEIEFPFLLGGMFDLILVQPSLSYLWEERVPPEEVAKAYIKRAMTYLKETGVIVLMGTDPDQLVPELKRSKRYAADASGGVVMVKRH